MGVPRRNQNESLDTHAIDRVPVRARFTNGEGHSIDIARNIIAAVRVAEIESNSSASGFTLLKFRRGAIDELVTNGRISQRELTAAKEFSAIFTDITLELKCSKMTDIYRIRQRASSDDLAIKEEEVRRWKRYKDFRDYWSTRKKRLRDPTLQVFVAAVIDEQPLAHIAEDAGLTPHKTQGLIIRGLRDYARRAER